MSASPTEPTRSKAPPGPRRAHHRLSPLTQTRDLQAVLFRDALADGTSPAVRAQLARAWVDLQDTAMSLQMRGKPRPVTARNDPASRPKVKPALIEPVEPEAK